MFKRCQVLLTDWQEEHYKDTAKKYDVSFSEMIRLALCLDTLYATKVNFPNFNINIDRHALRKVIKTKKIMSKMDMENFHKLVSKIYFESRKACELWKEPKEKPKRKKSVLGRR